MPLVVTICGSPAPGSRTFCLADEVGRRLGGQGFDVASIDVRKLPADALLHANVEAPEIRDAVSLVERADGLVVATPIYKASYSGVLKAFVDLLPQFGLAGKVVLPLAVGGSLAHVLAIDYALRPVLASMAAQHIVGGVFVLDKLLTRLDGGGVTIDPEIEPRLEAAVQDFASSLRRRGAG
jgi:FMN reductase